ncbi:NmrA family NAD(P)-binding protein [Phenylobacterium sp.]|uniref:NmrA family NAD(P)-binding protein n=1 Tax=Phenylobacterium sp. TaxID=1871053 RepID=UPI00286C01C3|nr:NAD(P)H-binding protein [Phenylobacterium sp.]
MFAIIGINGNTGSAAANALLDSGHSVRALVRDPARAAAWRERGVELITGDVTDEDALARTFDGVQGAYALVPPNPHHPEPLTYYREVATALRTSAGAAGLERLVFLSSEGAHLPAGTGPILGSHFAEEILAGAIQHVTFLRPSFFQQNWRAVLGLAREQGILPSMLQPLDARRPQVATADIGETAAALLTETAPPMIVELAGPEDRSANDAAEAMAHALGRDVAAVPVPREAWEKTLAGAGLGRAYAKLLAEMYDGINSGHVCFSGAADTRRGRRTLEETVHSWAG